jgi:uncharacterized protein
MPVALLDVNVLIALAWPNHEHHSAANHWLEDRVGQGWATCPMTECGFVRLSSNPGVIATAVKPARAIALLEQMQALPGHVFWPDDLALTSLEPRIRRSLRGHREITDAYLLILCRQRGAQLATFDAGIATLARSIDSANTVQLIPR